MVPSSVHKRVQLKHEGDNGPVLAQVHEEDLSRHGEVTAQCSGRSRPNKSLTHFKSRRCLGPHPPWVQRHGSYAPRGKGARGELENPRPMLVPCPMAPSQ